MSTHGLREAHRNGRSCFLGRELKPARQFGDCQWASHGLQKSARTHFGRGWSGKIMHYPKPSARSPKPEAYCSGAVKAICGSTWLRIRPMRAPWCWRMASEAPRPRKGCRVCFWKRMECKGTRTSCGSAHSNSRANCASPAVPLSGSSGPWQPRCNCGDFMRCFTDRLIGMHLSSPYRRSLSTP